MEKQCGDLRPHRPEIRVRSWLEGWIPALCIFLMALIPRISNLNAIITPDERRWVERSVAFFSALLQQDWAATFQEGHPGVTTMWTGTLSLWGKYLADQVRMPLLDYLSQVTTRPSVTVEYLAPARLPTAILTALGIVLVFLLLRRLFDPLPALLAAILLALDPFYLAHSRVIHHDALVTNFWLIALIALLGYVWRHQNVLWLILAGASAGLAFLSKGSALFLIPFTGLILLWAWWTDVRRQPKAWRQALMGRIGVGLVWLAVASLIFVALWPAMWVDPGGTLFEMVGKATRYAQEAHTKGNFFMGQPVEDPGLLFYPLSILFRTTPISLLGLLLFIGALAWYARRYGVTSLLYSAGVQTQVSLLVFLALFTLFMGMGSKKFDRYLLPAFPVIDILAGVAIAQTARRAGLIPWAEENFQPHLRHSDLSEESGPRHSERSEESPPKTEPDDAETGEARPSRPSPVVTWGLVAIVLVMQGLASLPQHPYYFSAYNALAGGPWLAMKTVLVGWGEGLEQAAYYLNALPDVEEVTAATFYYRDIKTFFKGQEQKLTDDDPDNPVPWQGSDYVVFYVNQTQRYIPTEATVRYFQAQAPEYAFERNGIPYVQVYRTPLIVPDALLPGDHVEPVEIDGKLEFLSYSLDTLVEDAPVLRFYWRALADLNEDYQAQITVMDQAGNVTATMGGLLYAEGLPTSKWTVQRVVQVPFELSPEEAAKMRAGEHTIRLDVSPGGHSIELK